MEHFVTGHISPWREKRRRFVTSPNPISDRTNLTLSDQVKKDVPSSWNPAALASFIDKYGTHVIVDVKMGGKDVVHIKQSKISDLPPAELQKLLKQLADERFSEDSNPSSNANPAQISGKLKDDHAKLWRQNHFPPAGRPVVKSHSKNDVSVRRGGIDIRQPYNQWLQTILQSPNVISMSFVPITSLLNSVLGNGFLSHAVNLYLRYKPAIEDLHHFLEFQLPRQWAPMYGDLPLGYGHKHKKNMSPSLQFSLMGPKLYVNTVKVISFNLSKKHIMLRGSFNREALYKERDLENAIALPNLLAMRIYTAAV
ncbi:MACPF domain-containing protein NSL1-like [Arachis ipaensis]|uniref:MACPF domain-containing protein NSL1-like n=1 Tax=Arachis ipaensis TaxID=130454 RepID=UPI000A2B60BD|nr:MACPF domain-containing protein NSL1-like [Arachis ipaensis]